MDDPVVQAGDPILRQHAKAVAPKDIGSPALRKLIAHMREVLKHEEYGVAIAAPQVGVPLRLFVVAGKAFDDKGLEEESMPGGDKHDPDSPLQTLPPAADKVFINPEIVKRSRKKREMSEGCLSVRGKYGTVMRHEKASVKALDEEGKPFTYHGAGLVAHIFQHECDHLDGILYIDKALKLEDDQKRDELREAHPA